MKKSILFSLLLLWQGYICCLAQNSDWERLRQAVNNHNAPTITIHPKSAAGITENLANGILWLNDNEDFINSDGAAIVLTRNVEIKAGNASKPITLYARDATGTAMNRRHFKVNGVSTLKMDGVILNGGGVAGFVVSAVVFYHIIRVENIGADLAAPCDFLLHAFDI